MKLGIVFEGGSRKVMFSAGVIDAMIDENLSFDYVLGVSAGAHCALNFVTKQRGRVFQILKPSKVREGKRAHAIRDGIEKELHILNYESQYGEYPFDFQTLFNSKTEYEICATCGETAKPDYFTERKDEKHLLDILNASCSLPILFPFTEIGGKHYVDGCISNSIPFDRAFEKGCDKVVIVSTKYWEDKPTDFERYSLLLQPMYKKKYPELYKALINRYDEYMKQMGKIEMLEEMGKVFVIKPQQALCGVFSVHDDEFQKSYNHGLEYTKSVMDKLKDYLKN
ncbi:MAG: patatin family protein [Treponema sp.]|nr:patatin family protein [Treponema sp.]